MGKSARCPLPVTETRGVSGKTPTGTILVGMRVDHDCNAQVNSMKGSRRERNIIDHIVGGWRVEGGIPLVVASGAGTKMESSPVNFQLRRSLDPPLTSK